MSGKIEYRSALIAQVVAYAGQFEDAEPKWVTNMVKKLFTAQAKDIVKWEEGSATKEVLDLLGEPKPEDDCQLYAGTMNSSPG